MVSALALQLTILRLGIGIGRRSTDLRHQTLQVHRTVIHVSVPPHDTPRLPFPEIPGRLKTTNCCAPGMSLARSLRQTRSMNFKAVTQTGLGGKLPQGPVPSVYEAAFRGNAGAGIVGRTSRFYPSLINPKRSSLAGLGGQSGPSWPDSADLGNLLTFSAASRQKIWRTC